MIILTKTSARASLVSLKKVEQNKDLIYIHDKAEREDVITSRIIRDTFASKRIKLLYKYKSQVCGTALKTKNGFYAEGAHIKPLGSPHNGPDIESNILCLCPNHHVMLDNGGLSINDDYRLNGYQGKLTINPEHKINLEFIKYHRESA